MFEVIDSPHRREFLGRFVLHAVIGGATSLATAVAAVALGMDGNPALLALVAVVAMLAGAFVGRRADSSKATWSWIPAALWFAAWVIPTLLDSGEPHFGQTFIGNGYCGDFSCAGQVLVTAPFLGSVVYVWAASLQAKEQARTTDEGPSTDQGPSTD